MANIVFTRTENIDDKPIADGQIIFSTKGDGKIYLDNGIDRIELGGAMTLDYALDKTSSNPLANKAVAGVMMNSLDDISNITRSGYLTDALATKQLNNKVTEFNNTVTAQLSSNNVTFNLDYQDDKWGWNEDSARGADTFHPFP